MDPAWLERARQLSRRYVDEGKVPFSQLLVAHRGHIELQDSHGWANIERRAPIVADGLRRRRGWFISHGGRLARRRRAPPQ